MGYAIGKWVVAYRSTHYVDRPYGAEPIGSSQAMARTPLSFRISF